MALIASNHLTSLPLATKTHSRFVRWNLSEFPSLICHVWIDGGLTNDLRWKILLHNRFLYTEKALKHPRSSFSATKNRKFYAEYEFFSSQNQNKNTRVWNVCKWRALVKNSTKSSRENDKKTQKKLLWELTQIWKLWFFASLSATSLSFFGFLRSRKRRGAFSPRKDFIRSIQKEKGKKVSCGGGK